MPLPLHGGFAISNGCGGPEGLVSEAGRVLSDAQDEGDVIFFFGIPFSADVSCFHRGLPIGDPIFFAF